jgi:hypothetical protein
LIIRESATSFWKTTYAKPFNCLQVPTVKNLEKFEDLICNRFGLQSILRVQVKPIADNHSWVARCFQWFLNRQVSMVFTPSLTVGFWPSGGRPMTSWVGTNLRAV